MFAITSCIPPSTRPIAKIGLVAPFEGLYRRTGYSALAAMQLGIDDAYAEAGPIPLDFLPLALDSSGRPAAAHRAIQKLLIDPSVDAIIGPVMMWNGPTAADAMAEYDQLEGVPVLYMPWTLSAFHLNGLRTSYSAIQNRALWQIQIDHYVRAVAEANRLRNVQRLMVSGLPTEGLPAVAHINIRHFGSLEDISQNDAILWLGDPSGGAKLYNQLRMQHSSVPFWMGPMGGDPVFAEHAHSINHVFWAIWSDSHYNDWAENHNQATPLAYLVYRSTKSIIEQLTASPGSDFSFEGQWQIEMFELTADGQSQPLRL